MYMPRSSSVAVILTLIALAFFIGIRLDVAAISPADNFVTSPQPTAPASPEPQKPKSQLKIAKPQIPFYGITNTQWTLTYGKRYGEIVAQNERLPKGTKCIVVDEVDGTHYMILIPKESYPIVSYRIVQKQHISPHDNYGHYPYFQR